MNGSRSPAHSRPQSVGMDGRTGREFTNQGESEFGLWAESKDCDLTRTQNFYELQSLVFRSTLEPGDTLTLLPFVNRANLISPHQLRLYVIEADRLALRATSSRFF